MRTSLSVGFVSHRGSIAGGSNGSAEVIYYTQRVRIAAYEISQDSMTDQEPPTCPKRRPSSEPSVKIPKTQKRKTILEQSTHIASASRQRVHHRYGQTSSIVVDDFICRHMILTKSLHQRLLLSSKTSNNRGIQARYEVRSRVLTTSVAKYRIGVVTDHRQRVECQSVWRACSPGTDFLCVIFLLGLCVIGSIRCELSRRAITGLARAQSSGMAEPQCEVSGI